MKKTNKSKSKKKKQKVRNVTYDSFDDIVQKEGSVDDGHNFHEVKVGAFVRCKNKTEGRVTHGIRRTTLTSSKAFLR